MKLYECLLKYSIWLDIQSKKNNSIHYKGAQLKKQSQKDKNASGIF
jgi:hypothetical protein